METVMLESNKLQIHFIWWWQLNRPLSSLSYLKQLKLQYPMTAAAHMRNH